MEKRLSIKAVVVEGLLNYLATKPYKEVARIISDITSDATPIDQPDDKDETVE